MTAKLRYFTRAEWTLWGASVLLIVGSFVLFHQNDYLTLTASLIGATSLMLNAKGNPAGQALTIAGGDVAVCEEMRPECRDEPLCCHRQGQNL